MGAERWDEQVGSVADEAARLLESLRRTAADAAADAAADDSGAGTHDASKARAADDGATAPTTGPTADDPRPGGATGDDPGCSDPFCQWCPLCRTSAAVRSLSPETLSRLADLAGVAAAVLADLANARTGATPGGPTPEDDRAGRVRPIPVRDADDPQEDTRG